MSGPNPFSVVMQRLSKKGLGQMLKDLAREGKFMPGTLVGIDRHGNRYYEDKTQFFGQDRRVDFNYDEPNASQVSSQWHGWFHHMTDDVPHGDEMRKKWQQDNPENPTGTNSQYVPYSTTKPKIQAWDPSRK